MNDDKIALQFGNQLKRIIKIEKTLDVIEIRLEAIEKNNHKQKGG